MCAAVDYACVSQKKLERLFTRKIEVATKSFSSLVRYQLLWREILTEQSFNVLDAVERFGFCDQAHLLNDFKARHLFTIPQAVALARSYC